MKCTMTINWRPKLEFTLALTPALSPEERENQTTRFVNNFSLVSFATHPGELLPETLINDRRFDPSEVFSNTEPRFDFWTGSSIVTS